MKYECKKCNYETKNRKEWYEHNRTQNHINKENYCTYCDRVFTRIQNLERHEKTCKFKKKIEEERAIIIAESNNKLKDLEIKMLNDKVEYIEKYNNKTINILEQENKNKNKIIENAGNIVDKSISTIAFLTQNYNKAPLLKPLEDYSFIEDEKILIENIIYHQKKTNLHEYLSKFLVNIYKKENPEEQSNWNSDTARLNYIIRDLVGNDTIWINDKKGIRTKNRIILPFLKYIKNTISQKMEDLHELISVTNSQRNKENMLRDMEILSQIISNINSKQLEEKLNKTIAPEFFFDINTHKKIKDE